ncbi:hypothetical protein [Actinomycetospora sp. CA-084318]|uniref:hypothetical protein n=1 Tax=Actinomycetospora sp. CA-084318 TaxID=3239892 RepID=UPI003D9573DF
MSGTSRRRRVVRRLVGVLGAAALGLALSASTAHAADADCTRTRLHAEDPGFAWLGQGLPVTWRMYVTVSALDRCDHGDLRVGVSFRDDGVTQKGADIASTSVAYRTSASPTWQYMPLNSPAVNGTVYVTDGHLDLSRDTRVVAVKVNARVRWGAGAGTVLWPVGYSCDLVKRTCSD